MKRRKKLQMFELVNKKKTEYSEFEQNSKQPIKKTLENSK